MIKTSSDSNFEHDISSFGRHFSLPG